MTRREAVAGEAFIRRLLFRYGAALVAYATRLVDDRGRGEEVAREALIRAWRNETSRKEKRLDEWSREETDRDEWSRDEWSRDEWSRDEWSRDETLRDRAYLLGAVGELAGIDQPVLLPAVVALPSEQYLALRALYFEGRDVAEAAAALGVSEAVSKKLVHHALQRLREAVTPSNVRRQHADRRADSIDQASISRGGGISRGGSTSRGGGTSREDATTAHGTELLGAYVIGVLDGEQWAEVQFHLAGCAGCRRVSAELREVEAALGEIPAEAFLDGPPPDGDLEDQTLLRVRDERARRDRRRCLRAVAVSVILVAVTFGGAAWSGRHAIRPASAASAQTPGPSAADRAAASALGMRTGKAIDAGTGATMAVTVVPAAGWVRVHAVIGGVVAGEQCRLYVVATDGSREPAGSWLAGSGGTTVDSAALAAPADLAAVQAETFAGEILVVVPV